MDEQDLIDRYEERAAIYEFEAGYKRAYAEMLARRDVYGTYKRAANPADKVHAAPPA